MCWCSRAQPGHGSLRLSLRGAGDLSITLESCLGGFAGPHVSAQPEAQLGLGGGNTSAGVLAEP